MERLCATLSDCTEQEQDSKAERTIVWAMQDELRRQDPLTRDQRQGVRAGESHQPYLVYEDDPLSGEDVADEFADPSLILHHRHEVQVLRSQISRLSDLQRQAVEWFLSEQPQDELAKKLGTSKSNVSKAKAAAMAHLRARLIAFGVHR